VLPQTKAAFSYPKTTFMKYPAHTLCIMLLAFITVSSKAQQASIGKAAAVEKQKIFLFKNHPTVINLTAAQLNNLFADNPGAKQSLPVSPGFSFTGSVISNIKKYDNLQTVAIRLSEFGNMIFSVSKRTSADKNVVYVGHLFSRDYADGYELKHIDGQSYQLVKIEMEQILPTCNLQKK
jgi:hypothetical protein